MARITTAFRQFLLFAIRSAVTVSGGLLAAQALGSASDDLEEAVNDPGWTIARSFLMSGLVWIPGLNSRLHFDIKTNSAATLIKNINVAR